MISYLHEGEVEERDVAVEGLEQKSLDHEIVLVLLRSPSEGRRGGGGIRKQNLTLALSRSVRMSHSLHFAHVCCCLLVMLELPRDSGPSLSPEKEKRYIAIYLESDPETVSNFPCRAEVWSHALVQYACGEAARAWKHAFRQPENQTYT